MRRFIRRDLTGVKGITAADYYQTQTPGGEEGVSTGFGVVVLFRVDSQSVASAFRMLLDRFNGGGYGIFTNLTNTVLSWQSSNGSGGFPSVSYTITAGNVGKIMMAIGEHSNDTLKLYVNRADTVTPGACVGYTAASPAVQTCVGTRRGTIPATSITIYGAATYRGALSLSQASAVFDRTKLAGDISFPESTKNLVTNLWSFRDAHPAHPPETVANRGPGTNSMSKVGSAVAYSPLNIPPWAW